MCVGEEVTLRVQVVSCAVRETARRRVKVLEALVSDDSGSMLAIWYNQAYLEPAFRERPEVLLKGVLIQASEAYPPSWSSGTRSWPRRGRATTSWGSCRSTRARPT